MHADAAGDFAAEADQLAAAFIPAPFTPRPIYYAPPTTTVTDTHQAILTRWHAGAGLILYNGHSSVRQWAAARIFHRDDVAALHNASQLPVVLEMTCFTGLFHEPGGTTLDETLLRAADGGAVAVWGATGLGVATGHQQLAQGFLASVFQRSGRDYRRGDARWQAAIGGERFKRAGPGGHLHPAGRPSHEAEPDARPLDQRGIFAGHPALAKLIARAVNNVKPTPNIVQQKLRGAALWGGPFAMQNLAFALMTERRPSAMLRHRGKRILQFPDELRAYPITPQPVTLRQAQDAQLAIDA